VSPVDPVADIAKFHEKLLEAERQGWRDPRTIGAALSAAKAAIESLEEIIEGQREAIEQLSGGSGRLQ
jgi:hypothetical protein